jgi:tetratricopeptide (TPR) repeat protein
VCGASLDALEGQEKLWCKYCNTTSLIEKARQVTAERYAAVRKLADTAFEGANYQEAYTQYTRLLELAPDDEYGWVRKGLSTTRLSTAQDLRYDEAMACFRRALQTNPASELAKGAVEESKRTLVSFLNKLALEQFDLGRDRLARSALAGGAWLGLADFRQSVIAGFGLVSRALEIDPFDQTSLNLAMMGFAFLRKKKQGERWRKDFESMRAHYGKEGLLLPMPETYL